MPVKLKAPPNAGPITHAGRDHAVEPDGSIEVPSELWPALSSHGFALWTGPVRETAADFFSGLNRNECFAWAKEHGLKLGTPITARAAQEACRAHEANNPPADKPNESSELSAETGEFARFTPAVDPPSDQQPFFEG